MATDRLSRRVRALTIASLLLVVAVLLVTGYGVYWLMSDRAPRTTLEADYKLAQDTFKLKPNDALTNERMGAVLARMGRFDESETYYLRAVKIAPKDARLRGNLSLAYELMGRYDKSLSAALAAIKVDPDLELGYFQAGKMYKRKGDLPKAKENLTKAVDIEPYDGDALFLLGQVLLDLGDKPGAAANFSLVKSLMKDYPGLEAALKAAGVEPTGTAK